MTYHSAVFTGSDYLDLINFGDAKYAVLSSKNTQETILNCLLKIFRAESAIFHIRNSDAVTFNQEKTVMINLSRYYTDQYIQYYSKIDPFLSNNLGDGAYRDTDLMLPTDWRRLQYYSDFIKPQKIHHLLVLHLRQDNRMLGHIGIHRHDNGPGFSVKDLTIGRFFTRVLALNLQHQQLMDKSAGLEKLVKQLGEHSSHGLIVLDSDLNQIGWNSTLADSNPAFRQLSKERVSRETSHPAIPRIVFEECLKLKKSIERNKNRFEHEDKSLLLHTENPALNIEIKLQNLNIFTYEQKQDYCFIIRLAGVPANNISPDTAVPALTWKLTVKETEIVQNIFQGLSNKEICQKLSISIPTLTTHIGHIFAKTGVNSKMKLISKFRTGADQSCIIPMTQMPD